MYQSMEIRHLPRHLKLLQTKLLQQVLVEQIIVEVLTNNQKMAENLYQLI